MPASRRFFVSDPDPVLAVVQPHCYGSLCAVMFCQKLHYDRKWSVMRALGAFAAYAIATAGFEVAMVYASRVSAAPSIHDQTNPD